MSDCIFCKIVNGEIPSETVYNGPHVTAFRDINPVAPVHVLIVPNRHIDDIRDPRAFEDDILTEMFDAANKVAEMEGVAGSGYRLLINYGPDANLVVPHLHLHLIGGRPLGPMVSRRK
ncbi:MAG: histidine triad nucleotide-binding protein [Chloroflexi bacterium]|nr:histidine triad nucleotide-binding protein [Chloroflexota bacterium]